MSQTEKLAAEPPEVAVGKATGETLEDYTLRFAPRSYRRWGTPVFASVISATGFPLAYYAARYNLDLDLITRGSGFGYYGSVVSNVIFATFTFIFFALEGLIIAQGVNLRLD